MIRKWQFILVLMTAGACWGRAALIYWNGNTAASTSISGSDAAGIASAAFTDPAANQSGSGSKLISDGSIATSSGYAGASGTFNFQARTQAGALSTGTSTYFLVTLVPKSGYTVTLDSISLGSRSTGTGPTAITIYSSIDDYATAIGSASVSANSAWALSSITFSGTPTGAADTDVTLRIYGSGGSGTSTTPNWRIDDISFTGMFDSVPEPAAWGAVSGAGLLALCGRRVWRQYRRKSPPFVFIDGFAFRPGRLFFRTQGPRQRGS